MVDNLIFRAVNSKLTGELAAIIKLLKEDELGSARENSAKEIDPSYMSAFRAITSDANQNLMVVEQNGEIIGTCHLTIMPSLTLIGTTRMNIEAVRIAENFRGQKIGEWMIERAIEFGKSKKVGLVQLTTNIKRLRTKSFYEKLGFQATHVGMKLKI